MSLLSRAAIVTAILVCQSGPLSATPVEANGRAVVPSCTPELVYVVEPGTVSGFGSGIAVVPGLDFTDRNGDPVATGEATIEWQAESILDAPAGVGAKPILGGNLNLVITTEEGHRITFDATCITGSGAVSEGGLQAIFVFANGVAKGWPGSPAQNSVAFFQALTFGDGAVYAYVQIFDGRDCRLNFQTRLTTNGDFVPGAGTLSASPSGVSYAETDCSARRGDPKPAEEAPGQNKD